MGVALHVKVLRLKPGRDRDDRLAVEQDRAEGCLFSLDILRQLRMGHIHTFPEIPPRSTQLVDNSSPKLSTWPLDAIMCHARLGMTHYRMFVLCYCRIP